MNTKNLFAELESDVTSNLFHVHQLAATNTTDTVGHVMNEEFYSCYMDNIRSVLCDADCYGISEETIQWFKARGIKG